ncbi:MAG TPA: DUF1800 family protein [Bacteroides sp.]|nr:DUF1800 family protein [Bacteroides sp.]
MASITEITGKLGRARAAHLLRRCTFGPTPGQITEFAEYTATEALDLLFQEPLENPSPPIDPLTAKTWVDPAGQSKAGTSNSEQDDLFKFFQAWHLDVMFKSPASLKERITWFYHTHLPARWSEIRSSEAIYYQNCIFRHYAFGSFKDLFKKICTDNAMLIYLDGYTNHKDNPNENFAREMFELYSIGKGPQIAEGNYTNYTEDDIRAATRVLTGWTEDGDFENLDPDTGWPTGIMRKTTSADPPAELATGHDSGKKTFTDIFNSAVLGPDPADLVNSLSTVEDAYTELYKMIDMIFGNIETARFITRKIYRSFVYHFISDEVETDVIQPLAQQFSDKDFSVKELLTILLKSQHFYDEDNMVTSDNNTGALIKSPADLFLGLLRFFDMTLPDRDAEASTFYKDMDFIVSKLKDQGLNFYEPFEVAGYPAYHQIPGYNRNWITTYALAHRYQTGQVLMGITGGGDDLSFKLNIVDWVKNSGYITQADDANEVVNVFIQNLIAVELTTDRKAYFLNTVFLDTLTTTTWQYEWNQYIAFNDDTVVRERLETLLSELIQTPEFQMY